MKINKNISISESGFVFNPTTGESFTVNPIGMEIINLLKMNSSDEDIKESILDKYAVDEASYEKDFYDFLQMLKSSGLINESDNIDE